jgi:hypothetical protein
MWEKVADDAPEPGKGPVNGPRTGDLGKYDVGYTLPDLPGSFGPGEENLFSALPAGQVGR